MDFEDVANAESLLKWLVATKQPQSVFVALAYRCALRTLSLDGAGSGRIWSAPAEHSIVYWRMLITGLAIVEQTPHLKWVAGCAATSNPQPLSTVPLSAFYTFIAPAALEDHFVETVDAAMKLLPEVWNEVLVDCSAISDSHSLLSDPIWSKQSPIDIEAREQEFLNGLAASTTANQFWRDWYMAARSGHPLPMDVVKAVALIDEANDFALWKAEDPAPLNAEIMRIYNAWRFDILLVDNPYSVGVEVDPTSGKLEGLAVETPDLSDVIDSLERTIDSFHRRCAQMAASNIGTTVQSCFGPILEILLEDVESYRDNPKAVHDALLDARCEIVRTGDEEGLITVPLVARLIDGLGRTENELLASTPTLLATVKASDQIDYLRYTQEQTAVALRLGAGLRDDSEGLLNIAAAKAVTVIADDTRSVEEKKEAWYFIKAVVPRGAKAVRDYEEGVDAASDKGDAPSVLERAGEVAGHVEKIGKGTDAARKAAHTFGPWVRAAWDYVTSGNWFN